MNLLLIDHYAGSEKLGMEYRPYYLAREWIAMGHQVTVAAADFTHLRRENPVISEPMAWKNIEGVPCLLVKTPPYEENDKRRVKNIWRFVWTLYRHAGEIAGRVKPQVVIASSTYPMDIYAASKIARAAGARLVFEVHDIHPETMEEIYGYSRSHPMMRAMRRAQVTAYRRADLVTSVLPGVGRHMKEAGVSEQKFAWIPNGISPEAEREKNHQEPRRHMEYISRYREKGYFIVMYVGGFAAANALDGLVEAAALSERGVLYIMVGNGMHKPQLKRWVRQHSLSNVLFLDAVDRSQVQDILSLADCLYLGARPLKVYRYGIGMNKIFDYMYSAKPILCAVDAPENPVELAKCGVLVKPGDPAGLAAAVRTLRSMPEAQRYAMGRRGKDYVLSRHTYPVIARQFAEELERIVKNEK